MSFIPKEADMALVMDPAEEESQALKKALNWRGKTVLEVGCGARESRVGRFELTVCI